MDLQKTFDTVDHEILLSKLDYYGNRGIPNNCVKFYLSNRKRFVSINGYDSGFAEINCGVPQGSVVGPLLFLLHINYLNQVKKKIVKYITLLMILIRYIYANLLTYLTNLSILT